MGIKVAICPNHGPSHLPEWLDKQVADTSMWRVELAQILDALPKTWDLTTKSISSLDWPKVHKQLVRREIEYFKMKDNEVVVLNEDTDDLLLIRIEDVDTSRVWMIDEYDGAEVVSYLNPTQVNPEINQYAW